jgi:hypothetical protein
MNELLVAKFLPTCRQTAPPRLGRVIAKNATHETTNLGAELPVGSAAAPPKPQGQNKRRRLQHIKIISVQSH